MNKIKQGLSVLLLSILLVSVAVAPILVMKYKNDRMFNHINVTALPKEREDEKLKEQNYDVNERLYIIRKSSNVIEQQADMISEEKRREILQGMEEQFQRLVELGCLPQIVFPDSYQAAIYKTTYMAPHNPTESISLWGINVSYDGYFISAYMDSDLSVLYGFTLMSDEEPFLFTIAEQPEEKFLEYLGLGSSSVDKEGERYLAESYLAENIISMFIATYNEDTQEIHSFYFAGNGTRRYNIVTSLNQNGSTCLVESSTGQVLFYCIGNFSLGGGRI